MFKFIVHCPYMAVEAALLRLTDSVATKGELSRAYCDVSLPLCVYRTAFPLANKELQVDTGLGGSLRKPWHEDLSRRQAALYLFHRTEMTQRMPKGWGREAPQLLGKAAGFLPGIPRCACPHHWQPWAGFSREGRLAGTGAASLDFPCLLMGCASRSCPLGRTPGNSGDAAQHAEPRAARRQKGGQGSPHPAEKDGRRSPCLGFPAVGCP